MLGTALDRLLAFAPWWIWVAVAIGMALTVAVLADRAGRHLRAEREREKALARRDKRREKRGVSTAPTDQFTRPPQPPQPAEPPDHPATALIPAVGRHGRRAPQHGEAVCICGDGWADHLGLEPHPCAACACPRFRAGPARR